MTSTRSYRGARGSDEALNELRANMGTQFDPAIVDAIAAALASAELAGRPWRGDGTACPGREAQPDLAELPPGAVVAQFDHDDPAYQLLAVDIEGAEKPQTDDYASGSEPPTDDFAEYETAVEEASAGEAPGGGASGGDTSVIADVSPPAETLPDAALPDAVIPDPQQPSAPAGPPGPVPPAPRDELRLAPFRPELNLPTQTKREPKPDRATDRDTPTNTGPETEGR
jgi:hypothetical protein